VALGFGFDRLRFLAGCSPTATEAKLFCRLRSALPQQWLRPLAREAAPISRGRVGGSEESDKASYEKSQWGSLFARKHIIAPVLNLIFLYDAFQEERV
jgi:hypothetical protein